MVTVDAQIQSGMMQYPSQDGTQINAYMSRPTTPGSYPGVIVMMEAMKLTDHMKDVVRRFACDGYMAIAPDLHTREGPPDPPVLEQILKKLFASPDARVVADMEGAASYLRSQADSNGKVGAIGFCTGGRYTFICACKSTCLDAAVDSAGGYIIETEHTPERPQSPLDMIPTLSCPVMVLFGEDDTNPSAAHAVRVKEELEKHGKTFEYRMYPNAGHAFFADYQPTFRAVPAQDMWHRVLVFFDKHLKASE